MTNSVDTLTDQRIPVARKQGVVTDVLGVRVNEVVVAAVNFVVAVGEARHLDDLASRLATIAAEQEGSVVAEVASAVPLDAGQVAASRSGTVEGDRQAGAGQGCHRPGPHGWSGRQDRRHDIRRFGEEPFPRRTRAVGLGRWLN